LAKYYKQNIRMFYLRKEKKKKTKKSLSMICFKIKKKINKKIKKIFYNYIKKKKKHFKFIN